MHENSKPLFRWAGGKSRLLKFYEQSEILPIDVDTYVEPFFGGGAMFLYVVGKYNPQRIFINDINPGIISIYQSIKTDVSRFVHHVSVLESQYLPYSKEDRKKFYYEVRHDHAYKYQQWSPTQESATLFFLMKTGFNGIWQINQNTNNRYGTPSGLLNETTEVFDRGVVDFWHNALQVATITCGDWSNTANVQGDHVFWFFDPPYRGSITSYGQVFGDDDQKNLLEFAKTVPSDSRVLLCNDDVGDAFFEDNLGDLGILYRDVKHTAGRRKQTDEGFEAKSAREIVIHNAPSDKFFTW